MSGGVGPCSDIRLPKEEHDPQIMHDPAETFKSFSKNQEQNTPRTSNRSFFTFRQMNALAVIIVLSASGMVSIQDFAFVVSSMVYIYFMSKMAFPTPTTLYNDQPRAVFGENNKFLTFYGLIGAVIGLFLPIAYIFEGIFEGDKEGIKAASPHVFLLASQVFMEGVAYASGFSLPIQVFVPIIYNSMRIFTLMEWLSNEIYKVEFDDIGSARRLYVGRALAIANTSFWCLNLFGFLLPIYLPKAFKIYYSAGQKAKKM